MLTFDDIVDSFARVYSKKIVVSDDTRRLSYGNLQSNGINLAVFLKKYKVVKGDRVAFLSYNRIEFAEILYATSKLGAIVTPINFRLSKEEIASIINDAKPKFFLYERVFHNTINYLVKNNFLDKNNVLCIDYKNYHKLLTKSKNTYPLNLKNSKKNDDWSLMYTSGTTG